MKIAALTRHAVTPDATAVGHHNFPTDCQAEPGTFAGLAGHTVEFFKHPPSVSFPDARSAVPHTKAHKPVCSGFRVKHDFAARRRILGCVGQEIDEHMPD